jgi:hypothetical protein
MEVIRGRAEVGEAQVIKYVVKGAAVKFKVVCS